MLLHLSSRRSYWLCNHCRIEMPNPDPRGFRQDKNVELKPTLQTAIASLKSNQPVAAV